MPSECPECGAFPSGDEDCQARYHRFLALEFSNPAYGTVHHLTVLAYTLQHPSRVSKSGWRQMRALLREFVMEGQTPELVRRRNRSELEQALRKWSFVQGPRLNLPVGFRWERTILSVDYSNEENYARDITAWAGHVLEAVIKLDQ